MFGKLEQKYTWASALKEIRLEQSFQKGMLETMCAAIKDNSEQLRKLRKVTQREQVVKYDDAELIRLRKALQSIVDGWHGRFMSSTNMVLIAEKALEQEVKNG